MWRSITYSILTIIIYYFIIKGFEEIFKYIITSNESLLNINEDYFYLADTVIYSVLILLVTVVIKKTANNIPNFKNVFSFKSLLAIILLGLIIRLFEDPFLRMDIVLRNEDFPVIEDLQLSGFLGKAITFFNVVLLAPVFEELVFRKLILNFFKIQNLFLGIILSSLLFALIHIKSLDYINYTSIILAFIFGVIACVIYLRYGLTYSIIFHVIYNLIWFVFKEYKQEYWNTLKELNFGFIYWLIFSFATSYMTIFLYKNFNYLKLSISNKN